MKKTIRKCDWCDKKSEGVFRTHFGTSQDYVRLMCTDCKKEIESNNRGLVIENIDSKIIPIEK